ncbi:MAG: hypothetical protein IPI67_31385 [Myxococcales bacterium]|nr:hypothetical protein [Myxococcales bacterium]
MKRIACLLMTTIALATSGCYSTTIHNGKAVGEAPIEGDQRWHHGFVGGTAEASGPYQLAKICPEGWAEIKTHTSFGNGLLDVVSIGLYNPQTVDVKCAAGTKPKTTAAAESAPAGGRFQSRPIAATH